MLTGNQPLTFRTEGSRPGVARPKGKSAIAPHKPTSNQRSTSRRGGFGASPSTSHPGGSGTSGPSRGSRESYNEFREISLRHGVDPDDPENSRPAVEGTYTSWNEPPPPDAQVRCHQTQFMSPSHVNDRLGQALLAPRQYSPARRCVKCIMGCTLSPSLINAIC